MLAVIMAVIDQLSGHLGSRTLSAEKLDRIANLDVLGLATAPAM
ncbi:hypothetical protein QRX50_21850 [Amycolatopsis carbonis]|uniref:Uncharacterized protein n=1 Tax=Amycolatopsis carbonis TaxID=715471 RepID=A0A9Y2N1M8_9PSEU|nr:hypothetical protein [Amycolatopsis sp. 2-15]WIX83214.1 hypothetical protein QRX50_21850 [Amycolatopsis sp. 2-15]